LDEESCEGFFEIGTTDGEVMAEKKNAMNAWLLLAAPLFIFIALHSLIPAIRERLVTDTFSMAIYICVALLIGSLLFRQARTVRDHEWHRRKDIKKLQREYAAEDRGVWSKADLAMSELEADAQGVEKGQLSTKALQRLDGSIGGLTGVKVTDEIESSEQSVEDVSLFSESEHVRLATSRVTGESGPVDSIEGVTHEQEAPEKGVIGGVLDKLKDTTTIRTSADPPVPAAPEPAPAETDWYAQEMSGVGETPTASVPMASGNRCAACSHSNPAAESYCENCGETL
jgi:hypothetical protein